MQVTPEVLNALGDCLKQTLSHEYNVRKQAEDYMQGVENQPNYSQLLLSAIDTNSFEVQTRQAAAITFKNFVRRNWTVEEESLNKINENDRNFVKVEIVNLMLRSPIPIQKQLSEAISIIGKEDFPLKWPGLMEDMIEKFKSGEFSIIYGILQTAHSLFKRYRHEFKSEKLWREIKHVLVTFAVPLTELFSVLMTAADANANNSEQLKNIFRCLVFIAKIFYSLSAQDIPEEFEDRLSIWFPNFHKLLQADNKILQTQDEEEAGLLEQLKSQICDNITMYATKYDEEFAPFLPPFVTSVWNLLVSTNLQVKYDILVSNAIHFLTSVSEKPQYKNLFEEPDVLKSICEKIIVTNIEFRECDQELFEINPEEYVRRDLEGSDSDTRRRAASDLIRGLCKQFEAQVSSIFGEYMTIMLNKYSENPQANWKCKDSALFLLSSLTVKAQTKKQGTTQTRDLVNVVEFFPLHVLKELSNQDGKCHDVLKAACLKYLLTFRNQLTKQCHILALPHVVSLLLSESAVVHSYSAIAVEKVFSLKNPDGSRLLVPTNTKDFAQPLLANLFTILQRKGSEENEYIMKCITRSIAFMDEEIYDFIPSVVQMLSKKLDEVIKNPTKPYFNHYLFESIALSVKIFCKRQKPGQSLLVTAFEHAFLPSFEIILMKDVLELLPYVLQTLAVMLERNDPDKVPPFYMELYSFLLKPELWERKTNLPAIVRLLQAYISTCNQHLSQTDKLSTLIKAFQRLVLSKTNDHLGFQLINTLVEHSDFAALEKQIGDVFRLIFSRLSQSKTTKFVKLTLVFLSLYGYRYGCQHLVELIDSIQPNIFGMVVQNLFISEVQKISGRLEKSICAVGITKILTDCPQMITTYKSSWPVLLLALIKLFELPMDNTVSDEEDEEKSIGQSTTFESQNAYSRLTFASYAFDPFRGQISDPKSYLAQCLNKFSLVHPGLLMNLLEPCDSDTKRVVQQYFQAVNIPVS